MHEQIEKMRDIVARYDALSEEIHFFVGPGVNAFTINPLNIESVVSQMIDIMPHIDDEVMKNGLISTPKKGQKICKKCGMPGHMAKTCGAKSALMKEPYLSNPVEEVKVGESYPPLQPIKHTGENKEEESHLRPLTDVKDKCRMIRDMQPEGYFQSVESVMEYFKIDKDAAIYLLNRVKKAGISEE